MIILRFYVYILAWFCFVTGVFGQDELDSLDEAIGEVTEASISSLHMRVEELERRNRELSTALMALGERLETLQGQMDSGRSEAEAALRIENEKLRQSLRLQYGQGRGRLPDVPIPNRDLLEEVLSEHGLTEEFEVQLEALESGLESGVTPDSAPETLEDAASAFRVVGEWGRSPEAVAATNGNFSTMKGMAIYVRNGTPRETMLAYARELHGEYQDYDNLSIEFFDRESSAQTYGDRGSIEMGFRVMSISKSRKSGRDSILIGRGSAMEEVR